MRGHGDKRGPERTRDDRKVREDRNHHSLQLPLTITWTVAKKDMYPALPPLLGHFSARLARTMRAGLFILPCIRVFKLTR
jgi:hypothetical protein